MLRDEHFHTSFLLRAGNAYGAPIFSSREMVIHRRRLLTSGPPWENAAVKPVQAETSAGPINTPTPGGCGGWDVANLANKKEFGNCRQDGSEAVSFLETCLIFLGNARPPKSHSEASEFSAVSCR